MAKIQVPNACAEVGLDCTSCTRNTARQLALASKGLPPALLTQLFVQLYPRPECSPMHARFVSAYREASDQVPKKPVQVEPFVGVRIAAA